MGPPRSRTQMEQGVVVMDGVLRMEPSEMCYYSYVKTQIRNGPALSKFSVSAKFLIKFRHVPPPPC